MSCKHPTLNDNSSLIPTRGLIYVAKVLNVFYIGKGLGEFLRTRHAVSLRGGRANALEGVFFLGGLIVF